MPDRLPTLLRWTRATDTDEVPRHQAGGMAALRILLGLLWLYNVAWKVPPDFGEEAGSGLYKFTALAVDHPVFPPYSWLVEHAILPHISVFGWLVLLAETALAVMLLSGTRVRLAALLGIAQSLAIGLSVAFAPGEWPWSYWLMIGAHLALLVGSSGRMFSVDAVRAGVGSRARLLTTWGVVAAVAGLYSVFDSFGDPLAARGPGLRSTDLSVSLGVYNLLGGFVLALVGAALLVAAQTPRGQGQRVAGLAAGSLAVAASVLLTVQIGFSDPLLGGRASSVALLLTLAAVALGATRAASPESTPSTAGHTDRSRTR